MGAFTIIENINIFNYKAYRFQSDSVVRVFGNGRCVSVKEDQKCTCVNIKFITYSLLVQIKGVTVYDLIYIIMIMKSQIDRQFIFIESHTYLHNACTDIEHRYIIWLV